MAYFNFYLAKEHGFSPSDVIAMQIIRQMRTEPELHHLLSETLVSDDFLLKIVSEGLAEFIKGKKKDPETSKLRLTKFGNKLMDNFETAEVEDVDLKLFDWLKRFYDKEGKMIGNMKRTKSGIAHFRKTTGITGNKLAFLLKKFISDDQNMKYNNKLENAFFSSKNLYSRKFNIDECRVYEYYRKRKGFFDEKFKTLK